MLELDIKDRKLIALLSRDCRAKLGDLGKELNLSKKSVKQRIERLQEREFISNFIPVLNYAKLQLSTFDLFLKLKASPEEEKELIKELEKHPYLMGSASLFGEWDIFIQFVSLDYWEFYITIMKPFIKKFNNIIDSYEVKFSSERWKFKEEREEFSKLVKNKFSKKKKNKVMRRLDVVDKKVLNALAKNARASFSEIGKEINESLETTRNHFNKLVATGIIMEFSIEVNFKKLGYVDYFTIVKHHNFTEERIEELKLFINSKKAISYAMQMGTTPEFFLSVSVKDIYDAEALFREMKEKFHNEIVSISNLLVTEYIREDLYPKGLMKPFQFGGN